MPTIFLLLDTRERGVSQVILVQFLLWTVVLVISDPALSEADVHKWSYYVDDEGDDNERDHILFHLQVRWEPRTNCGSNEVLQCVAQQIVYSLVLRV